MKEKLRILFLMICLCSVFYGRAENRRGEIQNPILSGFNPDPCIVRVEDDYYIVTSSFEWFPGIPVYHSKDLVNWEQIGHVLTRKSQLDLTGIADGDGVYAPSITYHDGLYYVSYTVVQGGVNWALKGYPNYIVTAKNPAGPWSEPVLVNALGFDPSLFIDEDGRAYMLVRIFDHRAGKSMSPGIGLHELDLKTLKPIGKPKFIYSGWAKSSAEGPKMLKKDGMYYLFTAEGGTGYGHYEAVARAKNIWGPYERAPQIFYSSRQDSSAYIQKAGHGTLFTTPQGEWYTTHLGSRPLVPYGPCPLGRETFIQKVLWNEQGWPELENGDILPSEKVKAPDSSAVPVPKKEIKDLFLTRELGNHYQFLREPASPDWIYVDKKQGTLQMRGRRALGGLYGQSVIAQRITSYHQQIETKVIFHPEDYRQSAGLCCFYNTTHFYALGLTYDEKEGTVLELTGADGGYREFLEKRIPVSCENGLFMRLEIDGYFIRFFYSVDRKIWHPVGESLDFTKLSDDYTGGYTGAMAALFVQDLMYENKWAAFDYFDKMDLKTE